jgi:tetratricopeptide (TPR) repeat protein
MDSKNPVDNRIRRLFKIPENRENLELLYKSLSHPSKGLSLCRVQPEEQTGILGFFADGPLSDRIHMIDMVNPPHGPMELQQTIIDTYDKYGRKKDIFFIYNIEGSIRLLKTTENDFFKGMNLIRDFFMQFEAEFVFFVSESLVKTIIGNAFDFYDWMKLTFIFVPESKEIPVQPVEPGERKEIEYSHPLEKIKYLENTIKKVKREKTRSMHLLELGKLYFQTGDYDNSLKHLTKSLEIEEQYKDLNSMAGRYTEIALNHKAKGNVDEALEFFTKAAKIFEENNDRGNLEIVRANMAGIHRAGTTDNWVFNWDELLRRIKQHNVIPVIGQGLYRVETEAKGESGVLLYDYLAKQVAAACEHPLSPDENHKFSKACLAFLMKSNSDYAQLSHFLKETLKGIRLVPGDSLWKLARIKAFNFFITTAYDDFLANTIKTVRDIPTEVSYYSLMEKNQDRLNGDLFHRIRNSQCTLVYHIFGNMNTFFPAYTENDIMETLLEFQKIRKGSRQTTYSRY